MDHLSGVVRRNVRFPPIADIRLLGLAASPHAIHRGAFSKARHTKGLLSPSGERQLEHIGNAHLESRLALAPWEFSLSDGQEIVELVCASGHKTFLSAARIRTGRHLWCAKCGADLRAESGQNEDIADDARRQGNDELVSRALHSVTDAEHSS